jgi:hypothetical protein
MHAKNFFLEFLDIFKNDFRSAGAYAPMSQSGFPRDGQCTWNVLVCRLCEVFTFMIYILSYVRAKIILQKG